MSGPRSASSSKNSLNPAATCGGLVPMSVVQVRSLSARLPMPSTLLTVTTPGCGRSAASSTTTDACTWWNTMTFSGRSCSATSADR